MSGIVGIFNLDGAPVDRDLLQKMTDSLVYRGPDRTGIWVDGAVGFGHTLLATTIEHQREQQPCTLDGSKWIVADARVDDRDPLKRELVAAGRYGVENATDVELILHAYEVWREGCVHHLLGDFAFAIWDSARQQLFCARDQIGKRFLYFARKNNCFLFSNELNCLRYHPAVSNNLNDLVIADYLLFGFTQDPNPTSFEDIERLVAGHFMTVTAAGSVQHRYWNLPLDLAEIRYKTPREYVDHFNELMRTVMIDQLRTDRAGIFLSGGLDSPTIARAAKEVLSAQFPTFDLRAYTVISEALFPDNEKYFANLVANALDIPIEFLNVDGTGLYEKHHRLGFHAPEPMHVDIYNTSFLVIEKTGAYCHVAFYGEDGDTLLKPATVAESLKSQPLWHLSQDLFWYIVRTHQLPPMGLGIISGIRRLLGRERLGHDPMPYPKWINSTLTRRLNLVERWERHMNNPRVPDGTRRPEAFRRLLSPLWQYFLATLDPANTRWPLEIRLPLMDVRMIRYLLALPSLPWCVQKRLLREAGKDWLPEPVRRRPKTPLSTNSVEVLLGKSGYKGLEHFKPVQKLLDYVQVGLVPLLTETVYFTYFGWPSLRPYSLNLWLKTHEVNLAN